MKHSKMFFQPIELNWLIIQEVYAVHVNSITSDKLKLQILGKFHKNHQA